MVDLAKDRLLKVNEVARRFRVHRRTVEGWMSRGLDCVMVGRLIYTSEEALARFAQPRDSARQQPIRVEITKEEEGRMFEAAHAVGMA